MNAAGDANPPGQADWADLLELIRDLERSLALNPDPFHRRASR